MSHFDIFLQIITILLLCYCSSFSSNSYQLIHHLQKLKFNYFLYIYQVLFRNETFTVKGPWFYPGVDNGHITSITKLSISKFIEPRLNIGWSLIFNLGIVEHRLTTYVRLKMNFKILEIVILGRCSDLVFKNHKILMRV